MIEWRLKLSKWKFPLGEEPKIVGRQLVSWL